MSKGAVQRYGSDTLAAMNAAGGGTNRPTSAGGYFGGGGVKKKPGPGDSGFRESFMKPPEWITKRLSQEPNPENWKLVKENGLQVEDLGGTGFDQRMVTVQNPAIQNKKGEMQ